MKVKSGEPQVCRKNALGIIANNVVLGPVRRLRVPKLPSIHYSRLIVAIIIIFFCFFFVFLVSFVVKIPRVKS